MEKLIKKRELFGEIMNDEYLGDIILKLHVWLKDRLKLYEYNGHFELVSPLKQEDNRITLFQYYINKPIILRNTEKKFKLKFNKIPIKSIKLNNTNKVLSSSKENTIEYYLIGGRSYMIIERFVKQFVKMIINKDLDINFKNYSMSSTDYDFKLTNVGIFLLSLSPNPS